MKDPDDISDYHLMNSTESWGGAGALGIKIFARSTSVNLLAKDENGRSLRTKFSMACFSAMNNLHEALVEQANIDDPMGPVRKAKIAGTLREEVEKQIKVVFVEETPNEYESKNIWNPWLILSTKFGRLKVGWRKNVIVLDWSGTILKTSGRDLFPNEDVTSGGRYGSDGVLQFIHCWGYDKLGEYVKKFVETCEAQTLHMSKWSIHGSYGTLEVDENGLILPGQQVSKEYSDILRFDVKEYEQWLQKNTTAPIVRDVDCVDIGVWVGDVRSPKYVEPEKDHRLTTLGKLDPRKA